MTQENKDILLQMLNRYDELGISSQIDYDKFYLYSIIVHSTAIEGSTVTEVASRTYPISKCRSVWLLSARN